MSLADEMAFEALPEEVQEIARRYFLGTTKEEADAVEAYRQGWGDAMDECEVTRPSPPRAEDIQAALRPRGRYARR